MINSWRQSVFDALKNDASVQQLVSDRIYDRVPDEDNFPFVRLGEEDYNDNSGQNFDSVALTFTVHIGSRYKGGLEVRKIAEAIRKCLHNAVLPGVLLIQFLNGNNVVDPDGITQHGIMRFQLTIHED